MNPQRSRSLRVLFPTALLLVLSTISSLRAEGLSLKDGIQIHVRERDGIARVAEPVVFAFPLAKKPKFKDVSKLVLVDPAGNVVPSQVRVTQRWKGGPDHLKKAIRWVLIDAQVDVPAFGEAVYTVRRRQSADPTPAAPPLAVSIDGGRLAADTGAALFEVGGARHGFLERLAIDLNDDGAIDPAFESLIAEPEGAGFVLKDRLGATYSSASHDFDIEIEEQGPLRTVVLVSGRHGATEAGQGIGRDFFKYRTRYTFYAGKPYVRVEHSLRNSYLLDPLGNIGFEGYALQTSLVTGQNASATFGIANANLGQSHTGSGPLSLYQDSDGGDKWQLSPNTTFRGFRLTDGQQNILLSGNQAPGYFHLGDGWRGVTLAMRDFYPNFPKGIAYDGDRTFRLEIFPEETSGYFWLDDGQQKTTDFMLYAHANVNTTTPAQVVNNFLHPLRPWCDPQWTRQTRAWADQGDLDDPPQEDQTLWQYDDSRLNFIYTDAFNQTSYAYGWSEFGELIWAKNTHTTGSPRNRLSYFERFMINGSPSFFRIHELFALHSRDLRTYHLDGFNKEDFPLATLWEAVPVWKFSKDQMNRDKLDPALAAHRAGIPAAGHGWNAFDFEHMSVDDLFEYHLLTGDAISRECVLEIAECIRTFLIFDPNKASGSTRGNGWAMRALVKAYQLSGDQRFLDSAREMVVSVRNTYNRVTPSPLTGIVYHWITRYPPVAKHIADAEFDMPWQMGPMIHGLLLYHRQTNDQEALDIVLDAADWLVDYAWNGVTMAESVANDDHAHVNPSTDNNGTNTWLPSALALVYRHDPRPEYLGVATTIYNSIPKSLKDWNTWTGWANYHWWHNYLGLLAQAQQ